MVLPYIKMNPPQAYTCSPSWTLLPPPSPYHPSGSSQCTIPKHPVSCIEPGLATHFIYDIIHISMPFFQIIPPSPSPTESKRLFYTTVSLCLFLKINIIKTFLVFKSIKGFFPLILSCSFSLSLEICVNTVERGFNFFIINNIYIYGDISLVLTLNKWITFLYEITFRNSLKIPCFSY